MSFTFDLVGRQQQRKLMVLIAAIGGVALLMMFGPASHESQLWHEAVERTGMVCILIGIIGRTWCTLYVGGHKLERLVTDGPYSVSRNPLYLFTFIATFGLGAQVGSLIFAVLCTAVAIGIFVLVVSHEERALANRFPDEFDAYRHRVPRFLPRVSRWQQPDTLTVRPRLVQRTFFDALAFLLLAPALKGFHDLRDAWMIQPLFELF